MPIPYERPDSAAVPALPAPRFVRSTDGRYVAGVCAGLAEHLGLPVLWIRLTFLILAAAGGAGVAAYGFLWAIGPAPERAASVPARFGVPTAPEQLGVAAPKALSAPGEDSTTQVTSGRRTPAPTGRILVTAGVLLSAVGALFVLQRNGIDVHAQLLVPILVICAGAVLAWSQLDDASRNRVLGADGSARGMALARLVAGVLIAVVGIVVLVTRGKSLTAVWDAGLATIAVLIGAALIAAPWVVRMWSELRAEQLTAARATERADIAAHLHDSVLQTLALIQRKADDPQTVNQLARAQERELRRWLYAGQVGSPNTLAAAIGEVTHEVEDAHGIPIELVVTGDRPVEEQGQALTRAFREALLNAVRHGAAPVSAYVEIGRGGVEAFVRDHGSGFDASEVPQDRLGVRESILGRMDRHGGTARVRRLESGTEVELTLPALPVTASPTDPVEETV